MDGGHARATLLPSPPPSTRARRVKEDLEQDPQFQKAYAKWQRVAERAVMPNYCHARTWRGTQCTLSLTRLVDEKRRQRANRA